MDVNLKGTITQQKVALSCLEQGLAVSVPIGDKQRYDLIIDYNNNLYRLQVKTAEKGRHPDTFKFSCRSIVSAKNGNKIHKYSAEEIDFFATIWEDKCYIVPVSECNNSKVLRLTPLKTKKIKYNLAEDYLLENQLHKM